MNKVLLISDLHFTENPIDNYQWDLFFYLSSVCSGYKITELIIAGDLTTAKDKHSSNLVNKLVYGLVSLAINGIHISIIMGNHDYLNNPNKPFFKFLDNIPGIDFITTPCCLPLNGGNGSFYAIPHRRVSLDTRSDIDLNYANSSNFVVMHETFNSAIASNGVLLKGCSLEYLDNFTVPVFSGDVHLPQCFARHIFYYIGSPYRVNFGDNFTPRIIIYDYELLSIKSKVTPFPYKHNLKFNGYGVVETIKELENLNLEPYDMVKIRCFIKSINQEKWNKTKQAVVKWCKDNKIVLSGIIARKEEKRVLLREQNQDQISLTNEQILSNFAKQKNVNNKYLEIGKKLLKGTV